MSAVEATDSRTILVVGATGSIGAAIVADLHLQGYTVIATGRDSEKLSSLYSSIQTHAADLTIESERQALVGAVGELHGVVFAAGIAPIAPVRYLKNEDLEACFALNATIPLLLMRDFLRKRQIKTSASIVFLSSVAAHSAVAGYAAYAGSKAALEASARCLAVELAPKGIRVNCISPGMVQSEMSDDFAGNASDEALEKHAKAYPLGLGQVTDVACAVSFLLSENARWITGVTLPVDGGFSL